MENRKMRDRGAEIGSGSRVSALATHTSGGDVTRHADSAQLGQRSAQPCCFGMPLASLKHTLTRSYKQILSPPGPLPVSYLNTHSCAGKHTELTPKMPRFWPVLDRRVRAPD